MTLSDAAAADAAAHLARLDSIVPGQVNAAHVVGSAVLDDYHPGTSDLDLVIELTHEPTEADLAVLLDAHLGAGAKVECQYLRSGALGTPNPVGSMINEGVVHFACKELHAVTRLQLASYATTLRGPAPAIEPDVPAAQEFCRGNLVDYWTRWLTGGMRIMLRYAPEPVTEQWRWAVVWVGLGPARLWHTINTGEIVSKCQAGELAAERWPDLAEPLLDIVAARTGETVVLGNAHGRAAVEVGRRIMAEAGIDPVGPDKARGAGSADPGAAERARQADTDAAGEAGAPN
ncbi:MAG TPA: aminoglycoside adenylyltransferase domain-containing protein [Pseudonocardiaceae bacterium]|nr:aminoglycoside adenylyltransferase domain-containing protein [Pseudonocardiaceae bacterium]